MTKVRYRYDVFLSHAVEDKIPIANELCKSLEDKKLTVWYSGTMLGVGDQVTTTIHEALDQCRFGVVILSPTYVTKLWALKELFILTEKQKAGKKIILPVLYNITPEELAAKSIEIADLFAVRADKGLEYVAEKLVSEIIKQRQDNEDQTSHSIFSSGTRFTRYAFYVGLILLIAMMGLVARSYMSNISPGRNVVDGAIQKRIKSIQGKAELSLQNIVNNENGKPADAAELKSLYTNFLNLKSYYRNEYIFNSCDQVIRSKKNVQAALLLDLESVSPHNLYTLSSPNIYRCYSSSQGSAEEKYAFYNTQPITYTIEESNSTESGYQIKVSYTNPVRLIATSLTFPSSLTDTKRHQMTITGLRPVETYSFLKQDDDWILKMVE